MLAQLKVQGVVMVTVKEDQQIRDKAQVEKENTGVAVVSTDPETVTSTDSQCGNILARSFVFRFRHRGKSHQSV